MMDSMCKDYIIYAYKEDIWLINPITKEWIASYYPKTKYAWWRYDFFETVYKYFSMDIMERQPIKNWIETRMSVEIGKNCEPDRFPGEYNWSSDFNFQEVIEKGKII